MRLIPACFALFLAASTFAQKDDGFAPLFNGTDLSGWTAVNTAPSTWSVVDGMLHCTGKPTGELRTTRMYQNFVLEIEWRHLKPRGNAGIFVWADDITARGVPFHRGIEVQVLENAYGNNRSHTTHGDIFPIHGAKMTPVNGHGGSRAFPTAERSHPSPEWNHYRITCQEGNITLAVNGEVVTRGSNCSPSRGYICLESEGGVVDYRNIRIKELPDTPMLSQDIATAARGFESLYNGVDLAGLQATDNWKSRDWILGHAGEAKGALETERTFEHVAFVLDVRHKKDSGGARLLLRGHPAGAIDLGSSEDGGAGWHRFAGELRGNVLTLTRDGQQVFKRKKLPGLPAQGPLRIEAGGAIDFANFYAREISGAKGAEVLEIPDVHRDEVICFALYTVHEKTLKLTAQLYPLKEADERFAELEFYENGNWRHAARAQVIEPGWTATFRIEDFNDTKSWPYRVRHGAHAAYQGLVRSNPRQRNEIVVCAFTGNSIKPSHGGDISRDDLVANVQAVDADLLFFSGDQVYDHRRHLAAWLKFGRDFGAIIKDRPTITIPDDHDVGQANLWGHGGKKSKVGAGHDGGYFMPVEYVQEVERAQTSHLPDPFDPTPIERGIGVYYTDLVWGGISFAILEDRKFKTGPSELIPKQGPRPDHIRNPEYDPASVDVPEARLLGERQLTFLDHWARDWKDAEMKIALSQTIFCGGAHIHGKIGGRLHADLDSNGWPQTGRNKAIAALRRAHALHLAGDQHLATIFHHGVDDWNDAIWSFCVPSIANLYLRWWSPLEPGGNRLPGQAQILGEHLDGFDNKVTAWAVANPEPGGNDGGLLTTRAAGFGIVRLDKSARTITMECWPRNVDVSAAGAQPYPGWPKTVHQLDNDGRKAKGWLPELIINESDAVLQVIAEDGGELIYALRISGTRFRPKVYALGTYKVIVGEGEKQRTFDGVLAQPTVDERSLAVDL